MIWNKSHSNILNLLGISFFKDLCSQSIIFFGLASWFKILRIVKCKVCNLSGIEVKDTITGISSFVLETILLTESDESIIEV